MPVFNKNKLSFAPFAFLGVYTDKKEIRKKYLFKQFLDVRLPNEDVDEDKREIGGIETAFIKLSQDLGLDKITPTEKYTLEEFITEKIQGATLKDLILLVYLLYYFLVYVYCTEFQKESDADFLLSTNLEKNKYYKELKDKLESMTFGRRKLKIDFSPIIVGSSILPSFNLEQAFNMHKSLKYSPSRLGISYESYLKGCLFNLIRFDKKILFKKEEKRLLYTREILKVISNFFSKKIKEDLDEILGRVNLSGVNSDSYLGDFFHNIQTFAIGSGGTTKGFFMDCYGLRFFKYDIDLKQKNTDNTLSVGTALEQTYNLNSNSSALTFAVYGLDNPDRVELSFNKENPENQLITFEPKDNETFFLTEKKDKNIKSHDKYNYDEAIGTISNFRNDNESAFFNLKLREKEADQQFSWDTDADKYEEVFVIAMEHNFDKLDLPVVPKLLNLEIEHLFLDNEFDISESEYSDSDFISYDDIKQLLALISQNQGLEVDITLAGCGIGKVVDDDVESEDPINQKDNLKPNEENPTNEKTRYTKLLLKTSRIENKLRIEINTFGYVSPLFCTWRDYFKDYDSDMYQRLKEILKVGTDQSLVDRDNPENKFDYPVPIYNQPLSAFRAVSILEALIKRMEWQPFVNTNIINARDKLLYELKSQLNYYQIIIPRRSFLPEGTITYEEYQELKIPSSN